MSSPEECELLASHDSNKTSVGDSSIALSDMAVSITACRRCRHHKLKCSRQRPVCLRCNRLQVICSYPEPPNRRRARLRPHARRQVSSPAPEEADTTDRGDTQSSVIAPIPDSTLDDDSVLSSRLASDADNSSHNLPSVDMPSDSYPRHLRSCDYEPGSMRASHGDTSISDPCQLPSRTVGLCLLEIYFTRIYNADILFCKPILFQEYLEDQVPTVLLRALFALASLFLAPRGQGENVSTELSELGAFSVYHSRSLPWAKAATREAMAAVMEAPSLAAAQALVCLTLYWFGTGDSKSADLCLAMAYRFCTIWNYRKRIGRQAENLDTSLESEMKRRCFWACWASMCIVAEPEPIFKDAWSEAAFVPLPSFIWNSPSNRQVTLGDYMDAQWRFSSNLNQLEPGNTAPPSSTLLKMIGIWARVQLFVTESAQYSSAQKIDAVSTLADQAASIRRSAVPGPYSNPTGHGSFNDQQQFISIDSFYCLCHIVLHSTIVPLFSGSPPDQQMNAEAVKQSAQAVLVHAESFTSLLAGYLGRQLDVTYLPPFVGYCAFITGLVLLASEISKQDKNVGLWTSSRMPTIQSIIRMLDTMSTYWAYLRHPCEKLRKAADAAMRHEQPQQEIPTKPRTSPDTCIGRRSRVRHTRNSGNLTTSLCAPPHDAPYERIGQSIENLSGSVRNDVMRTDAFNTEPSDQGPQYALGSGIADISGGDDTAYITSVDEGWWNMPFISAGSDFLGLDPVNLFRQGDDPFG